MTEAPVPGPVPRYELPEWREIGVVAGITGRGPDRARPFDLGLAGEATPVGRVMDCWNALLESLPEFQGTVVSRQVHGKEVRWQHPARGLVIQQGSDGHMTAAPGLLLAVTVADCIPVYLVDPETRVIALLHAGWRGVANGILERAIYLFQQGAARVDSILLHCGVGICGTCYQVGSEVMEACGVEARTGEKNHLDLRGTLVDQARAAGVVHISTSQFCSQHDSELFFSHRGSGGKDGRQVAYLGLL